MEGEAPPVALRLEDCALAYGQRRVLAGISLSIAPGEVATIIGRSGAGKTSLLSLIAGILAPAEGRVNLNGRQPRLGDPALAFLPQGLALFPWLNALSNVALALEAAGRSRSERRARAMGALADVGLADRAKAYPGELSGGERQRLALARAFVRRPGLVLLDEPFSSLDALSREEMQERFLELRARSGATALVVTHSIEEAVFLGDSVFILSRVAGLVRSARAGMGRWAAAAGGSAAIRESQEYAEAVRALRIEFDALAD